VHNHYRRQTDGRATANNEREREFTLAKNEGLSGSWCWWWLITCFCMKCPAERERCFEGQVVCWQRLRSAAETSASKHTALSWLWQGKEGSMFIILWTFIVTWRLVHCSQWLAYMLLITSGQSNLTQGHIAAAHGWFSLIHQVATIGTPSNAPPIGICTLLVLSPVSHFEHIDPQTCPVMAWVDPYPFVYGDLDPI